METLGWSPGVPLWGTLPTPACILTAPLPHLSLCRSYSTVTALNCPPQPTIPWEAEWAPTPFSSVRKSSGAVPHPVGLRKCVGAGNRQEAGLALGGSQMQDLLAGMLS